jgi:hypothetical protein
MRVLVACEFSGIVRDAFIARNHDALSCDLIKSERPGPHYKGDVRDILNDGWDLMVAHPPCNELSVSGNGNPFRTQKALDESLDFVRTLMLADIPKIAIENPVGMLSSLIRKPDQIVEPFWFGDPYKKRTCLWLKGLPLLRAQNISARVIPTQYWYFNVRGTTEIRAKIRARFWPGFAQAMAEQWG